MALREPPLPTEAAEPTREMMQTITPFLMFEGRAEEALDFYATLFDSARIERLDRYGVDQGAMAGKIQQAIFSLAGQRFRAFDSPVEHAFGFTPATSLFVECDSAEEVDRLFGALSAEGVILMPLESYPFSQRFGWVQDRFGLSWQLTVG